MVGLRQFSAIYIAAASSFAVAIVLGQHPALYRTTSQAARFVGTHTAEAAVALNDHVLKPGWAAFSQRIAEEMKPAPNAMRLARTSPPALRRAAPHETIGLASARVAANLTARRIAPPALRPPIVDSIPHIAALQAPPAAVHVASPPSHARLASVLPAPKKMTLAPEPVRRVAATPPALANTPLPPDLPAPSPEQLTRVALHLKNSLTSQMLAHFDLFLFVSKAADGPVGQRMYVFRKMPDGDLAMLYDWPVSTGREKIEIAPNGLKEPSFTPVGYYELDPHRMYVHHFSGQWRQPMPYSMFFNWIDHGYETGLAIHGATGVDISLLGTRSSAGCIHLAPKNAQLLFHLIRTQYKGLVPKFAYDKHTATMANDGLLMHDADGRLEMAQGYKVLVFIENYDGENVVAALF
jgi:lipoprotein-anchoring transpeptidase ErfK/SrfK